MTPGMLGREVEGRNQLRLACQPTDQLGHEQVEEYQPSNLMALRGNDENVSGALDSTTV